MEMIIATESPKKEMCVKLIYSDFKTDKSGELLACSAEEAFIIITDRKKLLKLHNTCNIIGDVS